MKIKKWNSFNESNKGKDEMVDPTMDSTGKHKALTLLQMYTIEELEEISWYIKNKTTCEDYKEGINMQCASCDQPKYKHK